MCAIQFGEGGGELERGKDEVGKDEDDSDEWGGEREKLIVPQVAMESDGLPPSLSHTIRGSAETFQHHGARETAEPDF